MGFLRVTCPKCRGRWYSYQPQDERANVCPHCFAEIDRQTWDSQILPGYGQMEDANRELLKAGQLFRVDYTATDIKAIERTHRHGKEF